MSAHLKKSKNPALDDLHEARRELLRQAADLWPQLERINKLEREAEKAEHELETARPASQAAIENHFASGGVGPLPGIDLLKQAELQQRAIAARRSADAASISTRGIEQHIAVITEELESNRVEIEAHGGYLREAS